MGVPSKPGSGTDKFFCMDYFQNFFCMELRKTTVSVSVVLRDCVETITI